MFDVDVTTCVALFLANILHLKPFKKIPVPKLSRKLCFATVKIKIISVTSEMIQYFFTVEKYQFYSHLICIEFSADDKMILRHIFLHG